MKGPAAEGARITEVVQRLAATRLDVHFVHVAAGREVLNAPPTEHLRDRAVELWGRDTARHLLPLPGPDESARIHVAGVVGKPQLARPNKGQLFVSINGRPVDAPEVAEAVRDAYGELLFRSRWPVAIVDISIDPSRVDVNVHPAKREVLFREPKAVKEAVEVSTRQALEDADILAEAQLPDRTARLDVGTEIDVGTRPGGTADEVTVASTQIDLGGGALEEDRLRSAIEVSPIVEVGEAWKDLGHMPTWLLSLRPVGQVLDTYIVCEGEDALYLVDQHALAERLTYESIKASAAHGRLDRQELLEPIELQPTEEQLARLDERRDVLESLGFSFFTAEAGIMRVVSLPSMLGKRLSQEEVDILLQDILSGEVSGTVAVKEAAIRSMACHLSIRAGERLSPQQVVGLLRGIAGSHDPLACVHGRPTVIRIKRGELERMFRRTE
jgi:DNA mismatch repair protein MutL